MREGSSKRQVKTQNRRRSTKNLKGDDSEEETKKVTVKRRMSERLKNQPRKGKNFIIYKII